MSLTTSSALQVDVRGPRFAAWITTVVLVSVLAIASFAPRAAGIVLAVQTVVFLLGATVGPRRSPYGTLFAVAVAPRLSLPSETEPAEPLRFAQGVGFVFALIGTAALLAGAVTLGLVAAGFALFAALLNAAFGVCLGCRMYPLVSRLRSQTT
ncbi:DUF4395 domain-containing protein [Rhodococcus sp. SJ-3]|uniref:DUF4395 domain-containing protein n=1 Tax=Rhodococcus sp. SJ-3 TaxID=3454628 RepID=UPI003F7A5B4F